MIVLDSSLIMLVLSFLWNMFVMTIILFICNCAHGFVHFVGRDI